MVLFRNKRSGVIYTNTQKVYDKHFANNSQYELIELPKKVTKSKKSDNVQLQKKEKETKKIRNGKSL